MYYGKITEQVYRAALELRGEDDTCWEERIPLAEPRLMLGPDFPEDLFSDAVIEAWEQAVAEATKEFGGGRFTLESLTVYLVEYPNTTTGEFVFQENVVPRAGKKR